MSQDNKYANLTPAEIFVLNTVTPGWVQNGNAEPANGNTGSTGGMSTPVMPPPKERWTDYLLGGVAIIAIMGAGLWLLRKHKKKK